MFTDCFQDAADVVVLEVDLETMISEVIDGSDCFRDGNRLAWHGIGLRIGDRPAFCGHRGGGGCIAGVASGFRLRSTGVRTQPLLQCTEEFQQGRFTRRGLNLVGDGGMVLSPDRAGSCHLLCHIQARGCALDGRHVRGRGRRRGFAKRVGFRLYRVVFSSERTFVVGKFFLGAPVARRMNHGSRRGNGGACPGERAETGGKPDSDKRHRRKKSYSIATHGVSSVTRSICSPRGDTSFVLVAFRRLDPLCLPANHLDRSTSSIRPTGSRFGALSSYSIDCQPRTTRFGVMRRMSNSHVVPSRSTRMMSPSR